MFICHTGVLKLYIFKAINFFIYALCLWVVLKKIFTKRLFEKASPIFPI